MVAIETRDLRKVYTTVKKDPGVWGAVKGLFSRQKSDVVAVKGLSLAVQEGEIVGFLGPNGAGKTTAIKMLTGILAPTSGEAQVLGYRPFDRRPDMLRQIALVMGNRQQLWWDLPAWDSFIVLRELYDVDTKAFQERIDYLLEALQLTDKVNTQVRRLSLGERMKCELVASLLHAPRVLFLDEPTIGLDLVSQKRIREFLRDFNQREGCSIVLTSHYMQDVEELCERVVVINHGELVYDGGLADLAAQRSPDKQLRVTFEPDRPRPDFTGLGTVVSDEGDTVVLSIPRAELARVASAVLESGSVIDLAIEEASVEDVIRDLFAAPSV